ncbi:MAG: DivIVA domain-containing protein [Acidobacteriota bacterium]
MTLDKIDLLDRKFSRSLIGYRRDEVDRLMAEAADSIGCLAEEKMALCRANDALRRELVELRVREATLRHTLLTTQQIVEDLKEKARQEAEGLLDQAREQARSLLGQAKGQAVALASEIDALAARKAALSARWREMLLAALNMLDAQAETAPRVAAEGSGLGEIVTASSDATFANASGAAQPTGDLDALDPFAIRASGKR